MKKISIISTVSLLPVFALAAGGSVNAGYFESILTAVSSLVNKAVVVLVSVAVVWFIWNVINYSMSEDMGKKEEAKQQMIWGIIAIAVIVSIWGLVELLRVIFGVSGASGAPGNLDNLIPVAGGGAPTGTTFDSSGNAYAPGYNPFSQ